MSEFHKVASVNDLKPGEIITVQVEGNEIALTRVEDQYYALHNACPHVGAPLGGGYIQDDVLTCPFHGWQFNVKNGEGVMPEGPSIACYPVKVENEDILISVAN